MREKWILFVCFHEANLETNLLYQPRGKIRMVLYSQMGFNPYLRGFH